MRNFICFFSVLISLLLYVACSEQSELNDLRTDSKFMTKSQQEPTFSSDNPSDLILHQTENMPMYIKHSSGKYLSILSSDDSKLCLSASDDGSGRQRWYINATNFVPSEDEIGYFLWGIQNTYSNKFTGFNEESLKKYSKNVEMIIPPAYKVNNGWTFHYNTSKDVFNIAHYLKEHGEFRSAYFNLSTISAANESIIVDALGYTGLQDWTVQPLENFTLDDLWWSLEPSDVVVSLPDFIQETTVVNKSSVTQSMSANFTKKATETSTFSKTEGMTVTMNASFHVGLPIIGGSGSITSTTADNWTFGTVESKEDTRSYTFNVQVPPNTTIKTKIYVRMNKLSANYIAKFKGSVSGKNVQLQGRWEGIQAGTIYYEIIEGKTNRVLRRIEGVPSANNVIKID